MKRNTMLKILNPILGVLIVNQMLTGLFADALPHEVFEVMHAGGGFVFSFAILLHVILNWAWVKATFFRTPASAKA